jgi:hypothetical protein
MRITSAIHMRPGSAALKTLSVKLRRKGINLQRVAIDVDAGGVARVAQKPINSEAQAAYATELAMRRASS